MDFDTGRVHYYEDLVDAAPGAAARWDALLRQLGAAPPPGGVSTPSANYTIIRAAAPVLDGVSNPDEVRNALAGGRHAWMLEE